MNDTEYKKDIIAFLESQKNWMVAEEDTAIKALEYTETARESTLLMVYHNSLINDIIARIKNGEIKESIEDHLRTKNR